RALPPEAIMRAGETIDAPNMGMRLTCRESTPALKFEMWMRDHRGRVADARRRSERNRPDEVQRTGAEGSDCESRSLRHRPPIRWPPLVPSQGPKLEVPHATRPGAVCNDPPKHPRTDGRTRWTRQSYV